MCGLPENRALVKRGALRRRLSPAARNEAAFRGRNPDGLNTVQSIVVRGFLEPGFFMPLKSWFKQPMNA
jgi:hypothetical protein